MFNALQFNDINYNQWKHVPTHYAVFLFRVIFNKTKSKDYWVLVPLKTNTTLINYKFVDQLGLYKILW